MAIPQRPNYNLVFLLYGVINTDNDLAVCVRGRPARGSLGLWAVWRRGLRGVCVMVCVCVVSFGSGFKS